MNRQLQRGGLISAGLTILSMLQAGQALAADECGTRVSREQARDVSALEALGVYRSGPAAEYILNVPVSIHIVHLDNGNGGISQADVDATMAFANSTWIGAGMQFFQAGATIHINNTNFYTGIDSQAEIDALRGTSSVPNTVNVYFTQNLSDGTNSLCGQATFTTSPGNQGIVVANDCTAPEYPSTFTHEMGHFFDLLHTHETVFGLECPNGSNCSTAGDLVCDTAADPTLETDSDEPTYNVDPSTCTYFGTSMRCGQTFNPDPTNLMSYAGSCRSHFTYGQNSRALGTLVNLRSNLVNPPQLNVTWVDFAYGGGSNGSFNQPYNSLAAAVAAVAPGGRIVIKAGSTNQTLTINKALTLDSFRGSATVGQ
ncbi:Pregnancy-associated plasma protein-A [Phycisphaerae bacterium RAS2]|nr:Pregnancy-associated plasma protein-A [Phycisphaerae bacterium RAS2]